jgi:hypothetical protein
VPAALGVVPGPHTLEIVLVPFDYDDGAACVTSPQLGEPALQVMRDALYQQLPIDDVVITVHARETWTQPFTELLPINQRLVELRMAEAALPQVVYYGVIDPCLPQTGTIGMAYGMLMPTSMEMSFTRCAAGLWWDDDIDAVADTLVHEASHTLGRRHVVCSGAEGFPIDGYYPVEGGGLDTWGFGILDAVIRPARSHSDFMSYCDPSWISRYGWNQLQPVIQTISSWPSEAVVVEPGRALLGVIGPEGSDWRVVNARLPDAPTRARVRIQVRVGELEHAIEGWTIALPDDPTRSLVFAQLAGDGDVHVVGWRMP